MRGDPKAHDGTSHPAPRAPQRRITICAEPAPQCPASDSGGSDVEADLHHIAFLHAIAWHHGPPPGSHINQASAEAVALWCANSMEGGVKARMEGASQLDDQSPVIR
jgi:hypothetical protein